MCLLLNLQFMYIYVIPSNQSISRALRARSITTHIKSALFSQSSLHYYGMIRSLKAPVYSIRIACLTFKCLQKPPPPTLFRCQIRGAVFHNFCNFPKPTISHSHPLLAIIGQVCWGEKGPMVLKLLSQALFIHSLNKILHLFFTSHMNNQVQHCAS